MERRTFGPPDSRVCRAILLSFGSPTAKLDPALAGAKVAHWQGRLDEALKREKATGDEAKGDGMDI